MAIAQNYYIENEKVKEAKEYHEENEGVVIYEVLRIIKGIPLFLEEHLKRMDNSFKLINKVNPYDSEIIKKSIEKLVEVNSVYEGNVKITVEVMDREDVLRVYYIPHSYPTEEQYENGVKTILYFGERENPNAKIVNNNFRNEVNEKIKDAEAYEAILVDRNGYITEGSRSNIFMIRGDEVLTSPLKDVLPGVTRGEIIELCKDNNLILKEEKVSYRDIENLDGLFITGTSPKILPISQVEGFIFNSNLNDIIKKLMKSYENKIYDYIN
ncbi:aminotransferase class IV [Clostridium paridis]|uniref:Aminotransferase class IV family protein n=1 Tax=Clostridium paridis TaxID=2803863 RepID=A0A937FIQ5_9CLOT|nr:aminotransferase class IV [Clostridium paridis]MBL4932887.1 aminotransferase class IV family protein [Clostridium paridis]